MSMNDLESFSSKVGADSYSVKSLLNSISISDTGLGIQVQDLYQYSEVKLNGFKVSFLIPIMFIYLPF